MADRTYEIRITGWVPTGELLDELGDVDVAEHEMRTVLSGRFVDQAALHGFLQRLRAYGLEIVEVRRVSEPDVPAQPDIPAQPGPRQVEHDADLETEES
ncbi:MAG TPA: hypothetical protein VLA97_08120 [Nocardioidaceae bacterium]|nr:hypothetical protein [Nocardioidaceae bacterium]